MNKILDKAALLVLFIICVTGFEGLYIPVTALLASVILSALLQVFGGKVHSLIFAAVWLALCFIHPAFCCAVPLLFYDILNIKKLWLAAPVPIALIVWHDSLTAVQLMLIILGIFVSFLLWRNIDKLERAENMLIETRDSSREAAILLQEKNRRLLEEQDNEINLATMKERNRIAREIHDNVGHMLTRSILQVGALTVINKDENLDESLENLKETLNNAMTSIRTSVHDLHDDSISLKAAAEEALKPLGERFKVNSDFDFSETMAKNLKLCFIGIIKECVSNAVKHSKGDKVDIVLREHPAFYHFFFTDNGNCDRIIKESGIGLSNIRERASAVGGIVNIESSESGFRVFVSAPRKV